VTEGDLLAEVQVEKMSVDVRAPVSGRVVGLLVEPGGVAVQGALIAVLEDAAEADAGAVPEAGTPPAVAPAAAGPGAPGPVASPSARRLARELGVDLSTVAGSGPGGRIVEADVRAATGGAPAGPTTAAPLEQLTPMRRAIAERLRRGLHETAQLTLTAEADVTELAAELERLSAAWGRRASYTEAALRACALALLDHPGVAARWTDAGLAPAEQIDIGVAVAVEDGLVVPVLRAADTKGLEELNRELAGLATRARAGQLEASDTEGGVFSITNLGAYRIDAFTPLLNPPQTAVLGLGRARPRPAIVAGAVTPRTLVVLSLTFDHRVLDGAPAAAFLEEVATLLEQPTRLLLAATEEGSSRGEADGWQAR
jgi:pyruvate/2-oxoglutarate dehydrogenase complex dihydrolipoamide acyltransferase (E2) component